MEHLGDPGDQVPGVVTRRVLGMMQGGHVKAELWEAQTAGLRPKDICHSRQLPLPLWVGPSRRGL